MISQIWRDNVIIKSADILNNEKITIISALVAASLLLGACDKTKAADNGQGERYAAPFGLTWGMTEEALVPRLGSQSETDNSEYVCPLTKVTSKTFSGGLNEAGEYEFRFLPQYGQPDFSGLVGIGYFYSTDDEAAYQTLLKELQHNLEAEYGKPSILESKKQTKNILFINPKKMKSVYLS